MVASAVMAAVALGAGCDDRRLDLRNIEGAMQDRYGREVGVPITEVTCPEAVRTKEGDTFDCTVTFAGGAEWTITVTQLGEGRTRWTPRGRVVQAADIEARTAAILAGQGQRGEARCQERLYVVQEGEVITCEAMASDGSSTRLDVRVEEGGELQIRAPGAPASR